MLINLHSFAGLTLHCSRTIPSLGSKSIELFSRFRERASAQNLQEVLLRTHKRFGLHLQDVRGITTDAAKVVIKLAKSLQEAAAPHPFFHQQCYAHGLHLVVMDILDHDCPDLKSLAQRLRGENEEWHFVDATGAADRGTIQCCIYMAS